MAATLGRRGPDDRRTSVLAPPETGRDRGEAELPAHRAGGRIPVRGAGLRRRLAYVTAAVTAMVALAFLIPLGWELRADRARTPWPTAAAQSATVAGALAVSTDPAAAAAGHRRRRRRPGRVALHGLAADARPAGPPPDDV